MKLFFLVGLTCVAFNALAAEITPFVDLKSSADHKENAPTFLYFFSPANYPIDLGGICEGESCEPQNYTLRDNVEAKDNKDYVYSQSAARYTVKVGTKIKLNYTIKGQPKTYQRIFKCVESTETPKKLIFVLGSETLGPVITLAAATAAPAEYSNGRIYLEEVNKVRNANGLTALIHDPRLDTAGYMHNNRNPLAATEAWSGHGDMASSVNAWVYHDPDPQKRHRAAVLGNYTHGGVGGGPGSFTLHVR